MPQHPRYPAPFGLGPTPNRPLALALAQNLSHREICERKSHSIINATRAGKNGFSDSGLDANSKKQYQGRIFDATTVQVLRFAWRFQNPVYDSHNLSVFHRPRPGGFDPSSQQNRQSAGSEGGIPLDK